MKSHSREQQTTLSLVDSQDVLRTDTYRGDDAMRLVVVPLVQNVLGGIAVAGALCVPLTVIYFATGWMDALAIYGALAVGAMVTFMATFIRFFADDFGLLIAAYYRGRRELQPTLDAAYADIDALEAKLRSAQNVVYAAPAPNFVAPEVVDAAYEDALLLLKLTRGVRLPGRGKAQMSQRRQEAATATLIRAGVLKRSGNNYDLNCSAQQALDALQALSKKEIIEL
jgi:hypothetical protein